MSDNKRRRPTPVPCMRCGAKPVKTITGFSFEQFKIACPRCKQPYGEHYKYATAVDEWNKLNTEQPK